MNTNQEKRMDQKQITELRGYVANAKPGGPLTIKEITKLLDALEAAQAELATAREVIEESMEARRTSEDAGGALNQLNNEIDRLRAELAALRGQVGGVVPDITDEDFESISILMQENGIGCFCDEDDSFRRIVASTWAYAQGASAPSSRVAGEGCDIYPTAYVDALESAANQFCGACRDKPTCSLGMMAIGKGCGAWRLDATRINSLRATKGAP